MMSNEKISDPGIKFFFLFSTENWEGKIENFVLGPPNTLVLTYELHSFALYFT